MEKGKLEFLRDLQGRINLLFSKKVYLSMLNRNVNNYLRQFSLSEVAGNKERIENAIISYYDYLWECEK